MQHRNVPLIAGGAAVLGAAVLVFVVLRSPGGQGPEASTVGGEATAAPVVTSVPPVVWTGRPSPTAATIPDRGIPALALPEQEPVGDAWRTIPPASGPFLTAELSLNDHAQTKANLPFIGSVADARPFTRRHAAALLAGLSPNQHMVVQTMALESFSELVNNPEIDPEIRAVFRQATLEYIGSADPSLAVMALAVVWGSDLWRDEEVLTRVRELSLRPIPDCVIWRQTVDAAADLVRFAEGSIARDPVVDRGIPALTLAPEEPVGDAWRTFAPASGPVSGGGLSRADRQQTAANQDFLMNPAGVRGARPFTRRHAAAILAGLSSEQSVTVRGSALTVIGSLSTKPDLDPEIRAVFRDALKEYVGAGNPVLAQAAAEAIWRAGMYRDEEVLARVRELALRPGPHDQMWEWTVDLAINIVREAENLP